LQCLAAQNPCRLDQTSGNLALLAPSNSYSLEQMQFLKFILVAMPDWQAYFGFTRATHSSTRSLVMSSTSTKIAIALLVLLAAPTASFARTAGEGGMGNVPISGIPPGPANAGGMNNVTVDPSGIGNASKIAPLPPPRISVPVIPHFK
jgi:hypothetical protein